MNLKLKSSNHYIYSFHIDISSFLSLTISNFKCVFLKTLKSVFRILSPRFTVFTLILLILYNKSKLKLKSKKMKNKLKVKLKSNKWMSLSLMRTKVKFHLISSQINSNNLLFILILIKTKLIFIISYFSKNCKN